MNLVLSFSSTFTGTKNEYMQALDVAIADNLSSGFQNLGTWTPNAITAVPAAVSVTPVTAGLAPGHKRSLTCIRMRQAGYQNASYLVQHDVEHCAGTGQGFPAGRCTALATYTPDEGIDGSSWMGPLLHRAIGDATEQPVHPRCRGVFVATGCGNQPDGEPQC